ncbi:MAG: signal peptidase II [Rhodospirillales bacterium]|nr:signal peptidase II [Rhodospirillales bacterium]MSP80329.1 signal peptidase II [Rhodospirillales bacterium]
MTRPRRLALGLGLALAIVVVDQISKWWILDRVMTPPRVIPVTPFFNLVMGWNRGVSFGMLNSDQAAAWMLSALALAIVVVLLVWMAREDRAICIAALGSVIGGALGNVIDRVRFGAVADFLDFHAFGYHWPAFNAADTAISLGALALLADVLFARPDLPKNKVPNDTGGPPGS